ncbi:transposase [Rhodococcus aetherivorans]|nr:transposase [Rhodococcus aetherivorans]WFS15836.1 transposase [Rhodococcus aetherivorans]
MGVEVVRYNYRLRPGTTAAAALIEEWRRCRFLWNEAVHQFTTGRKPGFGTLCRQLTEARARSSWLRDGSQVAQQQMLRTYAQALDASCTVKGRGRPRFKARKKTLPSLEYTRRGFRIRDGRLVLPKGVRVPVVWSRALPSEPSSVRITRDCLGHWYASFVVTREAGPIRVVEENSGVGIDWGVARTATATEERFDLPHHGHRKRCAAVVLVRPAYTTMTCARCFARAEQPLGLEERIFRCRACGHTACRDRNAARVVLVVAERGHTGVDDVSQTDHLPPGGGGGGAVAVRVGNLLPSGRRGVNRAPSGRRGIRWKPAMSSSPGLLQQHRPVCGRG